MAGTLPQSQCLNAYYTIRDEVTYQNGRVLNGQHYCNLNATWRDAQNLHQTHLDIKKTKS